MAQSIRRKRKRGNIRAIFNDTMQRIDFFRKTSKGKFILCNGFSGGDYQQGPGYAPAQLDAIENR